MMNSISVGNVFNRFSCRLLGMGYDKSDSCEGLNDELGVSTSTISEIAAAFGFAVMGVVVLRTINHRSHRQDPLLDRIFIDEIASKITEQLSLTDIASLRKTARVFFKTNSPHLNDVTEKLGNIRTCVTANALMPHAYPIDEDLREAIRTLPLTNIAFGDSTEKFSSLQHVGDVIKRFEIAKREQGRCIEAIKIPCHETKKGASFFCIGTKEYENGNKITGLLKKEGDVTRLIPNLYYGIDLRPEYLGDEKQEKMLKGARVNSEGNVLATKNVTLVSEIIQADTKSIQTWKHLSVGYHGVPQPTKNVTLTKETVDSEGNKTSTHTIENVRTGTDGLPQPTKNVTVIDEHFDSEGNKTSVHTIENVSVGTGGMILASDNVDVTQESFDSNRDRSVQIFKNISIDTVRLSTM